MKEIQTNGNTCQGILRWQVLAQIHRLFLNIHIFTSSASYLRITWILFYHLHIVNSVSNRNSIIFSFQLVCTLVPWNNIPRSLVHRFLSITQRPTTLRSWARYYRKLVPRCSAERYHQCSSFTSKITRSPEPCWQRATNCLNQWTISESNRSTGFKNFIFNNLSLRNYVSNFYMLYCSAPILKRKWAQLTKNKSVIFIKLVFFFSHLRDTLGNGN